MEYNISGLEIKVFIDENAIENIISEAEEWLEPYESLVVRKHSDMISVEAFNETNGNCRTLIDIDPSEHTYAEIYE